VRKQVQEGRTLTLAEELSGEERLTELAQMMGEVSVGTLQSAKEMLAAARSASHAS
jgi:DNA repair ATPase RecN